MRGPTWSVGLDDSTRQYGLRGSHERGKRPGCHRRAIPHARAEYSMRRPSFLLDDDSKVQMRAAFSCSVAGLSQAKLGIRILEAVA